MALYMTFHVIPDLHLDFLSNHPKTFHAYMEGRIPDIQKSWLDRLLGKEAEFDLPESWPESELEGFSPEVNHRQVKYFHYLLNGTKDKVHHSGCIFQTWFSPGVETVAITIDGENFALKNEHVSSLKQRIENISDDELFDRYRNAVEDVELSKEDKGFLTGAFHEIVLACEDALKKQQGLMWTAS